MWMQHQPKTPNLKKTNSTIHVGIDEAGRGCLAGPVYAGSVILTSSVGFAEFRDSKMLSEKRREELFELIREHHRYGVGFATVEEITRFNILNAAMLAMRRAFEKLQLSGEELKKVHVWVDGNQKIREFSHPQTAVIKGDVKVKSIAAASIVAKVMRDREIIRLDQLYPNYGYAENKGYGTETHRQAIATFGPTEHHRPTFAGVREHLPSGAAF
jgi:ribonuclease HII